MGLISGEDGKKTGGQGMNESDDSAIVTSDAALVDQARAGDSSAFAELWRRHARAAVRTARQFTSLDAEDLVSEAYTRIYHIIRAGGGPTGAFRPYLYVTVRNIASSWGAGSADINLADIGDLEDPTATADLSLFAFDLSLTSLAFSSLPERWQSVLWYTEVEGMDPHDVAPLLGMTANAVAALSYRAREGLRKAWLQAHINDSTVTGECRWAMDRMGEHARRGLSGRDTRRMNLHFASCARCSVVVKEVDQVSSRLASVVLPALLGGGIGSGALLASLGTAGTATAAGFLGALTAPAVIAGILALAVGLSVSVSSQAPPAETPVTTDPTSSSTPWNRESSEQSPGSPPTNVPPGSTQRIPSSTSTAPAAGATPADPPTTGPTGDSPSPALPPGPGSPPPGHTAPGGVVGADISLNLSGTGTPGAHVSLQASGQVYATTTIDANGSFSLAVTAIPGGLASLDLVQSIDRDYLQGLLPGGGAVAKLLGTVDSLVNALIRPLRLTSGGTSGIAVNLLS